MTILEKTLTPDLQTLVDTRLDLVDRVLMDTRVSRAERTSILQELEGQILEQVDRRSPEPSRRDVLAVLAELDPPEAFLSETDPFVRAERPQSAPQNKPMETTPQKATSCGLALWAGLLVGGVSLSTGVLMTFFIWFLPEVVLGLTAAIQFAALVGAALGCASLLRRVKTPGSRLERLVAGVAAATGPLTLSLGILLSSLFLGEGGDSAEFLVFILAGFVGGAWIHGAWLSTMTAALWIQNHQ